MHNLLNGFKSDGIHGIFSSFINFKCAMLHEPKYSTVRNGDLVDLQCKTEKFFSSSTSVYLFIDKVLICIRARKFIIVFLWLRICVLVNFFFYPSFPLLQYLQKSLRI